MSVQTESRPWRWYVEAVGAAVALMIVLLPGAGVLIRWIAFTIGNLPASAFQVAYSAPVSQLVATAVWSLRQTAGYLAYFFIAAEVIRFRRWRLQHELLHGGITRLSKREPTERRNLLLALGFIALGSIFMLLGLGFVVYLMLSGAGWIYQVVSLVGFIVMVPLAVVLVRGVERPRLRTLWPVVIVALTVAAIGQGLLGSLPGTPIGSYWFQSSVAALASNGRYQEMGQADGNLYLQNCADGRVIRVAGSTVIVVAFERPRKEPPSFLAILGGRKLVLGWLNDC